MTKIIFRQTPLNEIYVQYLFFEQKKERAVHYFTIWKKISIV